MQLNEENLVMGPIARAELASRGSRSARKETMKSLSIAEAEAALKAAQRRESAALERRMVADSEWMRACMDTAKAESACLELRGKVGVPTLNDARLPSSSRTTLGSIKDLQAALGGNVGMTYCSALKKAAGVGSVRKFDVDAVVRWRQENPRFKVSDAYQRR